MSKRRSMKRGTTKRIGKQVVKGELYKKIDETPSVAKETGSEKQSFRRIRDIIDNGLGLTILIHPCPEDPRTEVHLSYKEAAYRLFAMKKMAPIINLKDAKAFTEILELLQARLEEIAIKHGCILGEEGFIKLS